MKLPNSVRAALVTAVATFLTMFITSALGWLTAAQEAVSTGSEFPSVSVLGSAAVSALLAALAGFGNWVVRAIQERKGLGNSPVYPGNVRKAIKWQ